jgi:predicted metalloprotease
MSSVPGIPIEFSLVNSNIDEIKISSEDVEILTIDEQTSRIDRKESTYSIKEDIIVYFNPKLDKKLCTINLDLIKNGKIMETKKILITEENYEYFASVE